MRLSAKPNGSFDLTGAATLSLGAFSTDEFAVHFKSSDLAPASSITPSPGVIPNLNFGNLDVPLTGFVLNQDGVVLNLSKPLSRIDTNLLSGHLRTEFSSTVGLSFDFSTGALNGNLSGRWNWFTTNFGTAYSGGFDISGGISSNGSFTVNDATATGTYFFAPFWQDPFNFSQFLPKPNWLWGSINSEGYTLW